MRNRKIIITISELNLGNVIEINAKFIPSGIVDSNSIEAKFEYPNFIYLDNLSGTDLLWNTISSELEYLNYQKFPTQYELIPLKKSHILQSVDKTPRCYKFLIQKNPLSVNATNNVEVFFINYN